MAPPRSRRLNEEITEAEVLRDDSADEDFEPEGGRAKKRRRKKHEESSSDDEIDLDFEGREEEEEEDEEEEEEEQPVTSTGRPARRAATNKPSMKDSSEESDSDDGEVESEAESASRQDPATPPPPTHKNKLILKLRLPSSTTQESATKLFPPPEPPTTSPPTRRASRAASRMAGKSPVYPARRSARSSHEPELLELGPNVARKARAATRATSTILEEEEEDSAPSPPRLAPDDDPSAPLLESDVLPSKRRHDDQTAESPGLESDADSSADQPRKRRRLVRGTHPPTSSKRRHTQSKAKGSSKQAGDESSEYSPDDGEEVERDEADSDDSDEPQSRSQRQQPKRRADASEEELDPDELAVEAYELEAASKKRKRAPDTIIFDTQRTLRKREGNKTYDLFNRNWAAEIDKAELEDAESAPAEPRTTGYRGAAWKSVGLGLHDLAGPFGGGLPPLGGAATAAARMGDAGLDSDDSDDEAAGRGRAGAMGGTIGMTPTTSKNPWNDGAQPGGSASKGKKTLGDVDPVAIDQSLTFEDVGGRTEEINRLKQMVMQPLLYPEMYQTMGVKPPRGVLFYGPPGTGKTLLVRTLVAEANRSGQKITFFQRKGGDALSKWVGEAERQLKELFEAAKRQQPSIIFFDEIDGIAPIRSSKSESVHASIVSTLLSLMDGIEDRGQVIVIGATNRPDTLDPALRRGGRFDSEYYFSLPDQPARKQILCNITRKAGTGVHDDFLDAIASMTSGYAGADLASLCTEASLNAMQRTYPQIFESTTKLVIDPKTIQVLSHDFSQAMKRVRPAAERTSDIAARQLDKSVTPLLGHALEALNDLVDEIMPVPEKTSALEEAKFEQPDKEHASAQEQAERDFRTSMIYRPRLLLSGQKGMGQKLLAKAILHKFEHIFSSTLSLSYLSSDSGRSHASAINQLFDEARRQMPSIIYIPDIKQLYASAEPNALAVLSERLDDLGPHESVMVLGVYDKDTADEVPDTNMMNDVFGVGSEHTVYDVKRPGEVQRHGFFRALVDQVKLAPTAFPSKKRKARVLEELPPAPPKEVPAAGGEQRKQTDAAQAQRDRMVTILLKNALQQVADQLKVGKYKRFVKPVVDEKELECLKPGVMVSDLEPKPYDFAVDKKGYPGFRRARDGLFFYNIDLRVVDHRFHNGHYARSKEFLDDIRRIHYDHAVLGTDEAEFRARELLHNIEADVYVIGQSQAGLFRDAEGVYKRRKLERAAQREGGHEEESPLLLRRPDMRPRSRPASNGLEEPLSSTGAHSSTGGEQPTHPTWGPSVNEDVIMGGSQDGPDTQPTQQRSQRSAMTALGPNSQAADYQNSASTTTSGQKTSSGPSHGTQASNGVPAPRSNPPAFGDGPFSGASQLPDTQDMGLPPSSQSLPNSQSSTMPPPRAPLADILNDDVEEQPSLIVDEERLGRLHDEMVKRTSGFNVEQLEKINSNVMGAIWRVREEWNRSIVADAAIKAFNTTIEGIDRFQKTLQPSQQSQ